MGGSVSVSDTDRALLWRVGVSSAAFFEAVVKEAGVHRDRWLAGAIRRVLDGGASWGEVAEVLGESRGELVRRVGPVVERQREQGPVGQRGRCCDGWSAGWAP